MMSPTGVPLQAAFACGDVSFLGPSSGLCFFHPVAPSLLSWGSEGDRLGEERALGLDGACEGAGDATLGFLSGEKAAA
jgi:hypothetical protein